MINAIQIRSARALLDWSTAELARRAHMTVNAINRIERSHAVAQKGTMDRLKKVFEDAGIEFLASSGLRKKDKTITVFEGPDFEGKLLNDAMQTGANLSIAHANAELAKKISDGLFSTAAQDRQKKVSGTQRYIVPDEAVDFPCPAQADCHVIPSKFFSAYPLWAFGPKIALSTRKYCPRAVLVDNEALAESITKLFDYIWDNTLDLASYRALEKTERASRSRK
ncbi:MAG: helix-turn-helix transcriptional regulator [Alphaproteobacteria bacterium]|nr:helix-turn-helix transcriptional regulator [Alphaproteobacteria bacterium]